ncbi:STAS domain-containing protein [Parafrankia discariae]|uniref:STAS domain-containing protein n=1 Tax=Parafrankia discariae TaxID=365528 RepID=UPI0003614A73|nr:STAS domain-containing protein [Parafrankia discariae]
MGESSTVRAVEPDCPGQGTDQTLRLTGTVDVRSVGELRTLLHGAIDAGRGPLRVDVGGLELGDHAGVGVLLGGARRARALGRTLVLVDPSAALGRLLAVDRLGRLLRVQIAPDRLVAAAGTGGAGGAAAPREFRHWRRPCVDAE